MDFKEELMKYKTEIDNELEKYIKKEDCPEHGEERSCPA